MDTIERTLTAIHLLASTSSVVPVCEADKCKALGFLRVAVPGQKDSGDASESFEEIAEFLLFCQLAHLQKTFVSAHVS